MNKNMVKICVECGEDFSGTNCKHCGCDDYNWAYASDVEDRRTGGLDEDC